MKNDAQHPLGLPMPGGQVVEAKARRAEVGQTEPVPVPVPALAAANTEAGTAAGPDEVPYNNVAAQVLRLLLAAKTRKAVRVASELLVKSYGGWMRSYGRKLGYNAEDIEEMVNDTVHIFITEAVLRCDKPESFLRKIYKHVVIDRLRKDMAAGRIPRAALDYLGCPGDYSAAAEMAGEAGANDPLEIAWRKELIRLIFQEVRKTSAADAQLLALLKQGQSSTDAAAAMGISAGAFRDRIFRLRERLRKLFKDIYP